MPLQQRILVILGAALALWTVANKIRKNKIQMGDAIFWVVFAGIMVLLALFPGITFFFAGLLGFVSPVNLVFLVVVALLLFKVFSDSVEISTLKNKVETLAQDKALDESRTVSTPRTERRRTAPSRQTEGASENSVPDFLRKNG